MNLGKKIKLRREELGFSQEELAKKLGYKSRSTINKIELGINDITQHKIVAFAEALQTTPSYLMGWEEAPEHTKEDAVSDIFVRLREDSKFLEAAQILYELNNEQLDAVITMLSTFK